MNEETTPLTPEDIFQLVTIDKVKNQKVRIELKDSNGEVVPIHSAVEGLIGYMKEQFPIADCALVSQIYPLLSQALVAGLGRLVGIEGCAYYLMNDLTKTCFLDMMALSFLLLKYIQQKNLKIFTITEPITEVERQLLEAKVKEVGHKVTLSEFVGMNPKDILRELQKELDPEEIKEILGEKKDDILNSSAATKN